MIPPPTVPGIPDKNSKPLRLLLIAKSDKVLSETALPAIIRSSPKRDMLLKDFPSFITTPSNNLSEIKVFEPAPKINIFSLSSIFLKNLLNLLNFLLYKKFCFPSDIKPCSFF